MNLSFEQLRTLLAAAEHGSFSAAARHLGKAQSVVSTTIAHLEIDLGLTLFDRQGRTPRLTAAGLRIVEEARQILTRCQRLQALATELSNGTESRLTLAIDDGSLLPWLNDILARFADSYPQVELELLFPTLEDLTDMLLQGRAQLGIGYQKLQPLPAISARSLGHVRMPFVVAPSHPLAHAPAPSRYDLQQYRQITVTGRQDGEERQRFRHSNQTWWVESDQGVLTLIRRGLGWGNVPAFLLQDALRHGEVVAFEPDFVAAAPTLALELLWHTATPCGPAGQWLRQALLDIAALAE